MLKGAPMIKEEGVYGFEPSFIKGNSKLYICLLDMTEGTLCRLLEA
jgi:hypothetical protein